MHPVSTRPEQRRSTSADALIQAYIACKIAIDALPSLPPDVRADAEQPLRAFCKAIEPAINRHYPSLDTDEE
jgi:hypothetical protein